MRFGHIGAFESTKIHGWNADILGTTNHIRRWRHDLDLLRTSGIQSLRYSVPWHRIERQPGRFDFSWMDGPLEYVRTAGLNPIVDPLHHTSFPDWLEGGFANPELPRLYTRFVEKFANRYPWVRDYTVFNEPLPTTLFCSYTGMWYPFGRTDQSFVRMVINVGKAICQVTRMLRARRPDARIIHVDTCESHRALDERSEEWTGFCNQRRFLFHDLILGHIDNTHPLVSYLRGHGFSEAHMRWFQDHAAPFDCLGLDFYRHSEMEWSMGEGGPEIGWPVHIPRGFAQVCRDYHERYGVPMLLAETNIRGTVADRITWLRFMQEQYDSAIGGGVDLRGFCWYPSIDTTDWANCCTRLTRQIDPQGIWVLGEDRWRRIATELSECYGGLSTGRLTWRDLPAYRFSAPLDRELAGYLRLMRHWTDWRDIGLTEAA